MTIGKRLILGFGVILGILAVLFLVNIGAGIEERVGSRQCEVPTH